MTKKDKNDLKSIPANQGLMEIDTHEAMEEISIAILRSTYRYPSAENPVLTADELEMNEKVKKAYKEFTKNEWIDDNRKVLSTLLLGAPGQGKTTAFKQAAKKVAKALGLRYLENPKDETEVSKNDFVFTSLEFSAENSKMELGGIPAKSHIHGRDVMTRLKQWRLESLSAAGAGLLLLDDFPNASPNIQNLGLSLTDEKRYQGLNLSNVYIGLTGNMGAIDGTHTTRLSTALRGRCETYYTQDKVANFISRGKVEYNDEIGDVGVLAYLNRFEHNFSTLPQSRESGGFSSPRTWDNFIVELRRIVMDNGGRGRGELAGLGRIRRKAGSLLGLEIGSDFATFLHSMMTSAEPLARSIIIDGVADEARLKKAYSDGFSADAQQFGYQFAVALADYASIEIAKLVNKEYPVAKGEKSKYSYAEGDNKKMDEGISEVVKRLAVGLNHVDENFLGFSLDHFKSGLAFKAPALADGISVSGDSINTNLKTMIVKNMQTVKGYNSQKMNVIVNAITDSDKFGSSAPSRSRQSR